MAATDARTSEVLTNERRPAEKGVSQAEPAASATAAVAGVPAVTSAVAPLQARADALAGVLARAVEQRDSRSGPLLQRVPLGRGMQASPTDSTKPLIGETGSTLGVRPNETNEDVDGNVVAGNGGP